MEGTVEMLPGLVPGPTRRRQACIWCGVDALCSFGSIDGIADAVIEPCCTGDARDDAHELTRTEGTMGTKGTIVMC